MVVRAGVMMLVFSEYGFVRKYFFAVYFSVVAFGRLNGLVLMPVLVLMWFHCYLRTGEAMGLVRGAVTIGRGGKGVVSLGVTKGRRVEMVTVDDGELGLLAARVWFGLAPGDRIMEMPAAGFRRIFREILEEELRLKRMRYKPYSLRRGGATGDFRLHGRLDRALLRGRWKGHTAARQYILEGMEMATRLQRSAAVELKIVLAGRELERALALVGRKK